MELLSSVLQLFSAVLVFLVGLMISIKLAKYFELSEQRSIVIYFWHAIFCLIYANYAIANGGDATQYYLASLSPNINFYFGTDGVGLLTSLFSVGLGLSFFGACLIFNIFGFIGLLAFDGCLRFATWNKSRNTRHLANLIIFLPSVSFWSSGIGKDALSFMATCLALWAVLGLNGRTPLMIFAVMVMLFVRPHIAGMMIIGLTLAYPFDARITMKNRLIFTIIAAIVAASLVPFALEFAGVGEANDVESLNSYIGTRQGDNMEGGGGVDIANMSWPMKLVTYMFRPMIFEVNSLFSLAAAIDNLILLFLFIAGGRMLFRRVRSGLSENRVFMWAYAILAWLVLAMTTANLGIALRQKWMFAPMLIFLLISLIGHRREINRTLYPSAAVNATMSNGRTGGRNLPNL